MQSASTDNLIGQLDVFSFEEFAHEVDLSVKRKQVIYVRVWTDFHIFLCDINVKMAAQVIKLSIKLSKNLKKLIGLKLLFSFFLFNGSFLICFWRSWLEHRSPNSCNLYGDRHRNYVVVLGVCIEEWHVIINLLSL